MAYVKLPVTSRQCACGVNFESRVPSKKYCSDACRYQFRPIAPSRLGACSGCAEPIQITAKPAESPYCQGCRSAGLSPITHGSSGYDRGCRCRTCRDAVAADMRRYAKRRRDEGKPAAPFKVSSCVTCGEEFNARKRDGGFSRNCSLRCANIARNFARGFKPRPTRKSAFRRRAEKLALDAAAGTSGGSRVYVQGACIVCSDQFMSPGAASRYCSRDCRQKNRPGAFGLSWLDRMALFASDGWACQICSEPVDYTADSLSDWYPSVDHIVPRAHGGSDDISNLRTAHRWCNSVRGDLSYYTDADLAA